MESDQGSEHGRDEGRAALERDMVAPARARYDQLDATKGPTFTGKKQDWNNFDFKAQGFFDNNDLQDTLLGNDDDKDSEQLERGYDSDSSGASDGAGLEDAYADQSDADSVVSDSAFGNNLADFVV